MNPVSKERLGSYLLGVGAVLMVVGIVMINVLGSDSSQWFSILSAIVLVVGSLMAIVGLKMEM